MSNEQEPVAVPPEPIQTDNFVTMSEEPEFAKDEPTDAPAVESEAEGEATPEAENKADEVSEGEPKGEKSGDDTPAEPKAEEAKATRKPSRAEKRIKKLVSKSSAAERRAEVAEAKLAKLEGNKGEESTESTTEPTPPDESKYENYEDYLDALDKYDERMEKGPEAKAEEPKPTKKSDNAPGLTDSQKEAVDIVNESIESFEQPDDFKEKVYSDDFKYSPEILEAVSTCDDPAAVIYHLANNKEVTAGLSDKSPAQVARELVKIEDGLNAAPVKPIKTSNTPEPIKPVKGSDSQEIPDSELSYSDYEKKANERERKRVSSY